LSIHILSSAGRVSSQHIVIFGLQACYNDAFWKFYFLRKKYFLAERFSASYNVALVSIAGCVFSANIAIFGF